MARTRSHPLWEPRLITEQGRRSMEHGHSHLSTCACGCFCGGMCCPDERPSALKWRLCSAPKCPQRAEPGPQGPMGGLLDALSLHGTCQDARSESGRSVCQAPCGTTNASGLHVDRPQARLRPLALPQVTSPQPRTSSSKRPRSCNPRLLGFERAQWRPSGPIIVRGLHLVVGDR